MPSRLIIALALSIALHGAVLIDAPFAPGPMPRPPALQASLRRPPERPKPPEPSLPETLLKNTLDERPPIKRAREAAPVPKEISKPAAERTPSRREITAVRRKLSEYVFYPEQARALGLEGSVELFVELDGEGRVEDIRVVRSSGHAILDNAAVKGFYAVGRFPGKSGPWSYTFRLE